MQTKKQSLKEAITNTAVGFGVSYASTFLIFPLLGIATNAGTNLLIVIYFTVVSILRSYLLRRFFNNNTLKATAKKQPYWIHCFECETDTPVVENKDFLYCSNCGLKH